MKHSDIAALMKGLAPVVRDYIASALEPLVKRIGELEAELSETKAIHHASAIADAVKLAVAAMPKALDGKDADMREVERMVALAAEQFDEARSQDAAQVLAWMEGVEKRFDDLPKPRDGADGKNVDPSAFAQMVGDEVAKAIDALPTPQDGKSVTAEDMRPLVAELVSAALDDAVKAIPPAKDGRDGVDGKDGLDAVTPIIKDGVLLFTMSDGSIKEVGKIDGKDGEPGRDGVDGLGFDDLAAEYDGERGIVLRFVRGEQVKEFAFSMPVVIDRGVWADGKDGGYAKGDAVTWAGSVWISQKDSNGDKPDGGDGWRLSVKRGRDGKDGVVRDMTPKPVKVG